MSVEKCDDCKKHIARIKYDELGYELLLCIMCYNKLRLEGYFKKKGRLELIDVNKRCIQMSS